MRKLLALFAFFAAIVAAKAVIVPVSQTSNYLEFNFSLTDNLLTPGGVSDTLVLGAFPGTSLTLYFKDRLFLVGDQEQFSSSPSSGTYHFVQNNGDLDFSGSYQVGTTMVNWTIDSKVDTIIGNDRWSGTFVGVAKSVPDSGTTAGMIALGLIGVGLAARRNRR